MPEPTRRTPRRTGVRRAGLILLLVLGLAGCGSDSGTPGAPSSSPAAWSTAPASPLSPRHSARVVTVGDEVLVLGGDASPVCPPGASCVGPPQPLKDGAAYTPRTGTWRELADAPVAPSLGSAVELEGFVYVLTDKRLHAYDPAKDTWTELPAPPDTDGFLVAAGDQLLRVEPTHEGGVQPDHLYDPSRRTWRALPRDPLAPAFDRGAVWTGTRLVVLGKAVRPPPVDGVDSPTAFVHAATFDPLTWTWALVPRHDEVIGFGTQYVWTGDRVLLPYVFDYTAGGSNPGGVPDPTGGLLEIASGRWSRLPDSPGVVRDGLHVEASSRELVTAGEGLVLDVPAKRWNVIRPDDGAPTEGVVAAWVGRQLVVFGGSATIAGHRALTSDTRVWTAPS